MPCRSDVTPERTAAAYRTVRDRLAAGRTDAGHWVGELSSSSLATATAVLALLRLTDAAPDRRAVEKLVAKGTRSLLATQNEDGGWGDTDRSQSNLSTTVLAYATLRAVRDAGRYLTDTPFRDAEDYLRRAGGIEAVLGRYGNDKTFSVPILTHCAIAGVWPWEKVPPLPFELAAIPPELYRLAKMPVVSYALPALIAVGQARHARVDPPLPMKLVRDRAVGPTLRRLTQIQPGGGGFLEATPLTAFVAMSLAAAGRGSHAVATKALEFLIGAARADGSWPIDTNLATWVTTSAVNAVDGDVSARDGVVEWLRGQQYLRKHPYTNAAPGGWAWTDLSGGVPDADDTAGAVRALLSLTDGGDDALLRLELAAAVGWLLDLQNDDGGFPTFCRGWGLLPFDRSSADITAHVLRAFSVWRDAAAGHGHPLRPRVDAAETLALRYLTGTQADDGSWTPLWFGNEHVADETSPVFGTARVVAALKSEGPAEATLGRGLAYLRDAQQDDGSWGGGPGSEPSLEETALATAALLRHEPDGDAADAGVAAVVRAVEEGGLDAAAPIGLYFEKLWYYEQTYPAIFAAEALRLATERSTSAP